MKIKTTKRNKAATGEKRVQRREKFQQGNHIFLLLSVLVGTNALGSELLKDALFNFVYLVPN